MVKKFFIYIQPCFGLFIFTPYVFTALFRFSHRFQRLHLFTYLIPMLLPYCPCFIFPVCVQTSTFIHVCYSSYYFLCFMFQTMSSHISFFMLTVPVFGLSYRFIISMPFNALTTPNTIVVWVHHNYLYSGGSFQGVLLDLHISYALL